MAIHLHEGLAADVLLEDAATEHGAFAFALVAGIHARSHGPTVEDHGGGVLVFRGLRPTATLMPSPVQVGLKLEAVQQATAEGCRAVIITGLAA